MRDRRGRKRGKNKERSILLTKFHEDPRGVPGGKKSRSIPVLHLEAV